jgi:hypothetical protein
MELRDDCRTGQVTKFLLGKLNVKLRGVRPLNLLLHLGINRL